MVDQAMELLRRDADREYQAMVTRVAGRVLQIRLNLEGGENPPSGLGKTASQKLWEAVQRDEISPEEATDLESVHIVLEARTLAGGRRSLVVQTRATAGPEDVETARRRARTLRRATGIPAVPVVIAARYTPEALEAARGTHDLTVTPDPMAPIPDPLEEQDNAKVHVVGLSPLT